ncbi:rhomboid family intramembrane serine protease, partial [Methanothrix sp.]|uniref:rhomboid family intramembrane serine protease n=1 Tax=Methanothrix sp. TaxID=90426 RepID=UPI003BB57D26
MQSNLCSFSWFARKRLAWERWGGLGPLLARAGRREDYRNRDEWGDPNTPGASWLDRIGGLMPVSYSGIIMLICILVFFLGRIDENFVKSFLALNLTYLVERPWMILTHMFVHISFDHLFFNMLFLFFFGMELERRV